MKLFNRSALKRLLIFLVIFVVLLGWCWWAMIRMPGKSFRGPPPPLTEAQAALREELRAYVEKLGGEIGERNVFRPKELAAAADYIEATFAEAGLDVTRQTYEAAGEIVHNLIVEIPGGSRASEVVVVGAHYDSVSGGPGADDNATGTAAVLALAKRFAGEKPARTLRFVAFVNEEPPFFYTENQGSLVYARSCRDRGDDVVLMLSVESIGYYSTEPDSQKYPFPVGMCYPSQADFIGFVGRTTEGRYVRDCLATFRRHAQFPAEGAALPGWLEGIGWSDHWSFWECRYPAIMITDTTLFRTPHYHQASETPDVIDYDRMARVVDGLENLIQRLVSDSPLPAK